jgi:hypothetical protein
MKRWVDGYRKLSEAEEEGGGLSLRISQSRETTPPRTRVVQHWKLVKSRPSGQKASLGLKMSEPERASTGASSAGRARVVAAKVRREINLYMVASLRGAFPRYGLWVGLRMKGRCVVERINWARGLLLV